ncbi:hypothetical protein Clacol_010226 [Clathrus columnatus]|uniref:Peptidase A1 domain-containing protein n=1 Tax=Clathrus columnatus TaxID=1419009 RepID=A0AAV5AMP3_9AGAM|nr:hypothetical protein Clacol_010226 [Clathrus columnatus]
MSTEHRAILLKNDDPSIKYVGDWTTAQANTVNSAGTLGQAFSPTLHSIKTTGSSINVFGTENITGFGTTTPDPTWQCVVDGIGILPPNINRFEENNLQLCGVDELFDGSHELVVNVTSNGTPFYLDYLEYRSSPNVSRENAIIFIDNMDPAIDYISGWGSIGGSLNDNQTADPNSLVNVTFVGIQLSWYGFNPSQVTPHNASSGEYSIDGQSFQFEIPNLTPGAAAVFNQIVFTTPPLEMGNHVLSTRYTGMPNQTPLTLNYLIVTNGSSSSSSPTGSNGGSNPTSSNGGSTGNASEKNKNLSTNVGAIVGGVVGSIVGVVIVIALLFILRKFYRRRRRENPSHNIVPFVRTQDSRPSTLLKTSEIPTKQIQAATTLTSQPVSTVTRSTTVVDQHSDSDSAHSISHLPQTDPSIARNLISNETSSQSQPLAQTAPVAPLHPVQHQDSGIRLPLSVVREIEIPPSYTER